MTKIVANSMRFASVNGCAHTAVVYLAVKDTASVEDAYEVSRDAQPGVISGSITKAQTEDD